jgi:hypothetical protein
MKQENLEIVLDALAQRIKSLETDVFLKDYKIQDLEKKLKEAEEKKSE